MEFESYFPIWKQLTNTQQEKLRKHMTERFVKKGTVIHSSSAECTGLLMVKQGQLRAYMISEDGREVTLYRLFNRDLCLFSASCMIRSIQFDITIESEKDTEMWVIPTEIYRQIMSESAAAANFTNEVMASRFSEVMWLMDQILWKRFDSRLAEFLLKEASIEGTNTLRITHETIGKHLGNPREVITRMLKYFSEEGLVKLSRGTVELCDVKGLQKLIQ